MANLQDKMYELREAIALTYQAAEAKGATLPEEQDAIHMHEAVESIPSGVYGGLDEVGFSSSAIASINSIAENDLQYTKDNIGTTKNVPYLSLSSYTRGAISSSMTNIRVVEYKNCVVSTYATFYKASFIEYIIFTNCTFTGMTSGNGTYLTFGSCSALREIIGEIDFTYGDTTATETQFQSPFSGCVNLRELRLKNVNRTLSISDCTRLSYASLLYLVQHLITPASESYAKLTIGATNLSKLTATDEGNAAIAAAQEMGWTIA